MEDDFCWAPDYGRQVDKYYNAPALCVPGTFSASITEGITYRQHTMFSLLCLVLAALAQHLDERGIVEIRHVLGLRQLGRACPYQSSHPGVAVMKAA
jgi:hypothetical protein